MRSWRRDNAEANACDSCAHTFIRTLDSRGGRRACVASNVRARPSQLLRRGDCSNTDVAISLRDDAVIRCRRERRSHAANERRRFCCESFVRTISTCPWIFDHGSAVGGKRSGRRRARCGGLLDQPFANDTLIKAGASARRVSQAREDETRCPRVERRGAARNPRISPGSVRASSARSTACGSRFNRSSMVVARSRTRRSFVRTKPRFRIRARCSTPPKGSDAFMTG